MPVEDHPVHPSTRISKDKPHGCHNRPPFSAGYWAPKREYIADDGLYVNSVQWIQHTATTTCQNDIRATDAGCRGCKHIEDGK